MTIIRHRSAGKGFGGTAGKGKKCARGDFRGLLLSNQTHRSRTDGEAGRFRKSSSTGAFLSDLGHCRMENRHGLLVVSEVTPAHGYGERAAALQMAQALRGGHKKTIAADKGYDTRVLWLISALPGSRPTSPRISSRDGALLTWTPEIGPG